MWLKIAGASSPLTNNLIIISSTTTLTSSFFSLLSIFFTFASMAAAADTSTPPSRPLPVREDCWSEEATATLVEAWGQRYMDLNRGNLRQKDWQEVADAVNSRHGHSKKTFRTDVQCKNRVDTVKKKFKIEKARVSSSNGALSSSWRFYDRLDEFVGSNGSAKKGSVSSSMSPPLALPLPYRKNFSSMLPAASPATVLPQKRSAALVDDSYFRRNYSSVAAAAAAAAEEDGADEMDDEDDDNDDDDDSEGSRSSVERDGNGKSSVDGIKKLARAIERFGEIYEKVEAEKQRQVFELEKQRMQFAKDLEIQRMQMLMKTQVQLEKLKHAKGSGSNDTYS